MSVEDKQKLEYMKNIKRKFPISGNKGITRDFLANPQSYLVLAKNIIKQDNDEVIKNLNELIKKFKDISLRFIDNLKKDIQKD